MSVLILASLLPSQTGYSKVHLDVIEINKVYDEVGCFRFLQIIGWKYYKTDNQYHVIDFIMYLQEDVKLDPRFDGIYWKLTVNKEGKVISLSSVSFRQTWTQYDPEVADRAFIPIDERLGFD